LLWAKIRGYPWWPAKLISPESLTENTRDLILKERKKDTYLVKFFISGEPSYGWMKRDQITPFFGPFYDQYSKKNYKQLPQAIELALEESLPNPRPKRVAKRNLGEDTTFARKKRPRVASETSSTSKKNTRKSNKSQEEKNEEKNAGDDEEMREEQGVTEEEGNDSNSGKRKSKEVKVANGEPDPKPKSKTNTPSTSSGKGKENEKEDGKKSTLTKKETSGKQEQSKKKPLGKMVNNQTHQLHLRKHTKNLKIWKKMKTMKIKI